jgi:DNA-binding CsgD family transcriptional regulator
MFRRLRSIFRYLLYPERFIPLDRELALALTRLSGQEERPLHELGREMLRFALQHRQEAQDNLKTWRALTPREKEVTALACLGHTNKQIARRLVIAPSTVKTHLRNTKQKFQVRSKLELRNILADWDFSAWETS